VTARAARRGVITARPRLSAETVIAVITIGVLAYLVAGPVVMVALSSFRATDGALPFEPQATWSLQNYVDVFLSPQTYVVLGNTLVFAAGALVIAFAISIVLAWLVERTDLPGKGLWFTLTIAAIGIPGIISSISWVLLLNPRTGLVNVALRGLLGTSGTGPLDVFSMVGLIFVQALSLVPVTFLLIAASFRAMNPALEEAATTSGAAFRHVVRRVTLPMLTPALLSAAVYQFVNTIESFDIPLIIGLRAGIPLLSTLIYSQVEGTAGFPDFGIASAYSVFLLLFAIGPLLLYNRLLGVSDRYATISGKGFQPRRVPLGRWRIPALTLVSVFTLITFFLPLFVLVWTSIQPFYAVPSAESVARANLDAYAAVLASPFVREAFVNTLFVGLGTAIGTMTLALFVAWILVRSRSRFRWILDLLAFTPTAIPGVVIALSILLFYLVVPVGIYGTVWIIIIGLTIQSISLAVRLMSGGVAQVEGSLEEAGQASGASAFQVLRRIVLPLVLPALINGALLVFLTSIQRLTVPLMLFTPDTIVLSTLVWNRWDRGNTSEAAALGVIIVVITMGLSLLLRWLGGARGLRA
jgi:iron(III) transport system permease protein